MTARHQKTMDVNAYYLRFKHFLILLQNIILFSPNTWRSKKMVFKKITTLCTAKDKLFQFAQKLRVSWVGLRTFSAKIRTVSIDHSSQSKSVWKFTTPSGSVVCPRDS